ncbi:MAG: hypothetical protein V4446_11520 [Pseudomonadota bacterium]
MKRAIFQLGTLLMLACISTATRALDNLPDGVQLHGFASQSLIGTDHNNFFGQTQDSASLGFTELGANISWRINPKVQMSAQAISRRAGETDNGTPRLDYATLDLTAYADETSRYGLYLGKIKNPYGLYNETRDVAFARPSILLPQSIYFDRLRNFSLASPGISLYTQNRLAIGDLSMQISAVRPNASDEESERTFLGKSQPGNIDSKTSYIGRLLLEPYNARLKLALTGVQINAQYQPGGGDALQAGVIDFRSWILSAQYNAENWVLTSEYARRHITETGFGPFFPNGTTNGTSYYVQAAYTLSPRWNILARYDSIVGDDDDKDGIKFLAKTGQPTYSRFARDWTAGVTYNASRSWQLRGEYHHVDGTFWLPYGDNTNPASTARYWNMWLLQAAYRF